MQDSFVTSYRDIINRELTTDDDLSFMAGPYYLNNIGINGKHTADELIGYSDELIGDNGEGIKSSIRKWISIRLRDKNIAAQRRRRMLQVFYKIFTDKDMVGNTIVEKLTKETKTKFADKDVTSCMAYDVLAYNTIKNQQTYE